MIRAEETTTPLVVSLEEVELTPAEQAEALARRERYFKNLRWFEAHVVEIRKHHSGKSICVAGQALFSGDDPKEVAAQARATFPGEWGSFFTIYVPPMR